MSCARPARGLSRRSTNCPSRGSPWSRARRSSAAFHGTRRSRGFGPICDRARRRNGEISGPDHSWRVDEVAFGRGFKALRLRKRLRQDDLAAEAGVSRGAIARIEQGHAAAVTVETLEKVARPLGARVVCRLTWQGEGLDRLLDAGHAAIVEQVVRALGDAGWLVATEVSFNIWGERGSIGCRGQVCRAGRPGDLRDPGSQGTARPGDCARTWLGGDRRLEAARHPRPPDRPAPGRAACRDVRECVSGSDRAHPCVASGSRCPATPTRPLVFVR
jgi:transcriptional regulator with XRE-family HTH domain